MADFAPACDCEKIHHHILISPKGAILDMEKKQLIEIREGKARLLVPRDAFKDPFHLPVFYNPAMKFNRSISSISLSCALELLDGAILLDGLCALGPRGIRYACENKIEGVYFVDANPDAIKVLRKNIKLNKLKAAHVADIDLNKFLLTTDAYFDFIEIDPFGSPVFFLQNAIRKLKKKSVLSITATDLANLAGANSRPCIKHYDARPLRCEYSHEVALRILLGRIARDLMMQDFGCAPLISFYRGHAIKCMVFAEKSAESADAIIPNLGYIMHCHKCLNRESGKRQLGKCPNCGEAYDFAGELWIGNLGDGDFLNSMQKENLRRGDEDAGEIKGLLEILKAENDFSPSFYDLHTLAKKHGLKVRKTQDVVEALKRKRRLATRTHYSPTGIKSDASAAEIALILKGK